MTIERPLTIDRRRFLQAGGLAGAGLLAAPVLTGSSLAAAGTGAPGSGVPEDAPRTGFELREGASWTTHEEELEFLELVAASKRVRLQQIGTTHEGRPLHLVTLAQRRARAYASTTLVVGSQHGNEPAGRETALAWLRDLAFTEDELLVRQLRRQQILFVPSANPDGREANSRENAVDVDINRDHLALTQPETQAIAAVLRDRTPDLVLDLHEYGPSVPVLYDDEILYLWPRNLNVDQQVHDLSVALCEQYIKKGAEAHGFTADEYGLFKVGDQTVEQTAGDEDEGICRNAVGLRHSLGVLVESAVSMEPRNGEVGTAAVMRRRVASQRQVLADTLRFLREQGRLAAAASTSSPSRKTEEGRRRDTPVFFAGADNDPPADDEQLFPPPSGYRIGPDQAAELAGLFALHGITSRVDNDGATVVPMAQPAEPLIPLLLDPSGKRHVAEGERLD